MIPFIQHSGKVTTIGTETRSVVAREQGWGRFDNNRAAQVTFLGCWNCLYLDCGGGYVKLYMLELRELYTKEATLLQVNLNFLKNLKIFGTPQSISVVLSLAWKSVTFSCPDSGLFCPVKGIHTCIMWALLGMYTCLPCVCTRTLRGTAMHKVTYQKNGPTALELES